MIEPGIIIPFIFGIPTIATVIFFLGFNIGGHNGMSVGKDSGIVYCMEQPKNCKISYDYLKLQEKQK
jgi:hypothetical protein